MVQSSNLDLLRVVVDAWDQMYRTYELRHEISNNLVCASLIRAFASRLTTLSNKQLTVHFECLNLKLYSLQLLIFSF